MNSLNIITSRVSPSASPQSSRSNSLGNISPAPSSDEKLDEGNDGHYGHSDGQFPNYGGEHAHTHDEKAEHGAGECTPLLDGTKEGDKRASWWHTMPRGFVSSIISSIRWVFATLASPGVYLMACFYDEHGVFAPLSQLRKLFGVRKGGGMDSYPANQNHTQSTASTSSMSLASSQPSHISQTPPSWGYRRIAPRPAPHSSGSSTSGASSESEGEVSKHGKSRHGRSKSLNPAEELSSARRSIRIKVHNDDALRQRKHRRAQSSLGGGKPSDEELSAQLKSPTSPTASLTKYPKTPAPPRPLIPRRQPSYLKIDASMKHQKTLILDLDETLIHSMSKGGRSTGHMVEVRLNTASLGMGGAAPGGAAQHPILYWVNKRPYCDEFLRRACKWFNLVIFTASVQEYADPVIDWLEAERKFFSARYYRQHCTYRQGAYIKDLSSVEADLSKVMILDNSPLSYLFHEGMLLQVSMKCFCLADPLQTMRYPSRAGSMTLRTMI